MDTKRWTVRVSRTLHDKQVAVFDLGPHRFKLWARAVAWLETSAGHPFRQTAQVLEASGERPPPGRDPWGD
ncbi:hypothetical protein [Pseudorhodoferax sp. Leaf267]|uniref:hypothetical protein n=1 Tax=Pseudorhodoferax sp. Leaf267 TaxID=1736316 RepID=UPI0012E1D0BC|nr:hypothetical protein [Pseudorhodoferax sp. Leaf267]